MLLLQSVGYEPKQGDVVVLTKAFRDVDGPIVKRVIAVGGQTVDIDYDAGTVAVDGEVLDEPYIHEATLCPTYENQTRYSRCRRAPSSSRATTVTTPVTAGT